MAGAARRLEPTEVERQQQWMWTETKHDWTLDYFLKSVQVWNWSLVGWMCTMETRLLQERQFLCIFENWWGNSLNERNIRQVHTLEHCFSKRSSAEYLEETTCWIVVRLAWLWSSLKEDNTRAFLVEADGTVYHAHSLSCTSTDLRRFLLAGNDVMAFSRKGAPNGICGFLFTCTRTFIMHRFQCKKVILVSRQGRHGVLSAWVRSLQAFYHFVFWTGDRDFRPTSVFNFNYSSIVPCIRL